MNLAFIGFKETLVVLVLLIKRCNNILLSYLIRQEIIVDDTATATLEPMH